MRSRTPLACPSSTSSNNPLLCDAVYGVTSMKSGGLDLVEQSRAKVDAAAQALTQCLLEATQLSPVASSPSLHPCQTWDEAIGYRCRCSFQVLKYHKESDEGSPVYHYCCAIRHAGHPIAICDFPVANRRIQSSMQQLLQLLNSSEFPALSRYLTSLTFTSSWDDDRDCVLTLHYHEDIPVSRQDGALVPDRDPTTDLWIAEAQRVCAALRLRQLTRRARGTVVRAMDDDSLQREAILADSLVLERRGRLWTVQVSRCAVPGSDSKEEGLTSALTDTTIQRRRVEYIKPEGAFLHPNPRVMCQALSWILTRLQWIVDSTQAAASVSSSSTPQLRLLELYCGCGAHTVAVAQSQLVSQIVAVEFDRRLVAACERNGRLNHCGGPCAAEDECYTGSDEREGRTSNGTSLRVVSQDAGTFVRHHCRITDFDILLVDPPKQGLDDRICQFLQNSNPESVSHRETGRLPLLSHVLYVSCGADALRRDLARLLARTLPTSSSLSPWEVVDTAVLDLFPGTGSVETLVHLQRRNR